MQKKLKEEKLDLIVSENASERLDAYLANQKGEGDKELGTRAYFKRLIGKGAAKVNGKYMEKASYKPKAGDRIEVVMIHDDFAGILLPEDSKLDIEYEDQQFLFVNKPSGMVVHPGAGNPKGTLANALLGHLNKEVTSGPDVEVSRKVGLAHRLDKDTSGGILIVKDQDLLWRVMRLFAERKVEKYYLAICYAEGSSKKFDIKRGEAFSVAKISKEMPKIVGQAGDIKFESVTTRLVRHPKDRRKVMVSRKEGRLAETHYRVLARVSLRPSVEKRLADSGVSELFLILLKPVTGRLHQLRVHMKSVGLPILGDPVYGKGHEITEIMYLHSFYLGFGPLEGVLSKKWANKTIEFYAKLPQNWDHSLNLVESI